MRAGLLDRAERLFSELIETDAHTPSALRSLLEIYQQEKDWEKALEQAQRLEQVSGEHMGHVMAQFSCELAENALADNDREGARRQLRQARRNDPRCVRARFLLADIALLEDDPGSALDLYEEIAELDADNIPELLEDYREAALAAGDMRRYRDKLDEWAQRYKGISLILKLTDFISSEQGGDAAGQYLVEALANKPSVKGLDRLIELKASGNLDTESSDDILRAVTTRLLTRQPQYRCHHCGFSGQTHHWLCPSCRNWNTTKRIQGVLGE
jgi:lipopolysaccharide biosynthesis regulator YciM